MKAKFTWKMLFILVLVLLTSCSRGSDSGTPDSPVAEYPPATESGTYPGTPEPQETPKPETILTPVPTPNPIFHSGNTRAQYIEDLDYLYEILKANFPHINALYRARGVCLHELFANARYTLEAAHHHSNFIRILHEEIFDQVNRFGHMDILDSNRVRSLIPFRLTSEFAPFIEVMGNPASRAFYSLTDADFEPHVQEEPAQNHAQNPDAVQHQQGNVETKIIEQGRIAYVRIHQMSARSMAGDYLQLIQFYESIASYEHLIVDIRGNPGGDSRFFPDLVIAPNINQTLYTNLFMFFMAGEHNMRFLKPLIELGWLQVDPVHPGVFEELPHFSPQDIQGLDYYVRIVDQINPSRDKAMFGGKIWLLIDGRNFSASGDAVEIVKQTGFATLVGEPTGSSGTGINPTIVALPNSGILIQYSSAYGTGFTGRNGYEYGTQPHMFNFEGMCALETTLALIERGEYYEAMAPISIAGPYA
ncbi:MAG: S41 family peptidase [Defluviitaleaceae bacterium]|nr:S41 family peptidase [Defluviitaleaceae bacterium]